MINNTLHKIFKNLKIESKLGIIKLSKYTYHNLVVTQLKDINNQLTNEILQLKIFRYLEKLHIYCTCKEDQNCICKVDQNGIQNLDLIELRAHCNKKNKRYFIYEEFKNT